MENSRKRRIEHETEAGVGGALAGAAVGAIAGPPGAIVGAVIGATVGALADAAVEDAAEESAKVDAELDREIGVVGGDLGAPNLAHPTPRTGAYSAASMGAGTSGSDGNSAEGPMQTPS